MRAQSPNPNSNDVEKAHLIMRCNDFMIAMNKPMRTMARKKRTMKAPNA